MADSPAFDSKAFLKTVSRSPGVYQMFDGNGRILYVGKAKNLRSRLASYFRSSGLSPKTESLVARIASVEVTLTDTEVAALVLEQNLIKSQRPPYNILLRDDKSYPYIFLSSKDDFPRLALHRGQKKRKGEYFGPYPNVGAVRDTLSFLQKTFNVRQCEDSVFRNRSRPCLQYQIKRCTGPCVGLVTKESYANDVRHTVMYLQGKANSLSAELADNMEAAAEALEFEKAAHYRDQISALRQVQAEQVIEGGIADVDVISVAEQQGSYCVHVLYVREGRVLGSRSYFPKSPLEPGPGGVLEAFLPQFYFTQSARDIPREIVLSHQPDEVETFQAAMKEHWQKTVSVLTRVRSQRAKWLKLGLKTAEQNLFSHVSSKQNTTKRYDELRTVLGLEDVPQRMECFDISHSSGELTVASCVVFDQQGPAKSDYRRFNIEGIVAGDDYAAMEQALTRRYSRLRDTEAKMPDLLIIDGGKGQLAKAVEVMHELGLAVGPEGIVLLGIAKGTTRKAGFETLYLAHTDTEHVLNSDSPALHLLQEIRDEAHRFAITGHKQRRDKKRRTSELESIPGVGAKRRRELLRHFGGFQDVKRASVDDLVRVSGISKKMAEEIYAALHND